MLSHALVNVCSSVIRGACLCGLRGRLYLGCWWWCRTGLRSSWLVLLTCHLLILCLQSQQLLHSSINLVLSGKKKRTKGKVNKKSSLVSGICSNFNQHHMQLSISHKTELNLWQTSQDPLNRCHTPQETLDPKYRTLIYVKHVKPDVLHYMAATKVGKTSNKQRGVE